MQQAIEEASRLSPQEGPEFWEFQGQQIRIGTVDQFVQEVYGLKLEKRQDDSWPVMPAGLALGIEKYKDGGRKWYRLIWVGRGQAWLTKEDETEYQTKRVARLAGMDLSNQTGAFFSEFTR